MADKYEDEQEDTCRDFLRNVCTRGDKCKFRHPPREDTKAAIEKLVFCHDYQNSGCPRRSCKFLHCTKRDEEYFQKTGELPEHLRDEILAGGMGKAENILSTLRGEVPICKDFQKGECQRGQKCKYRHLDPRNEYNDFPPARRPISDLYFPEDDMRDFSQGDPVLKRRRMYNDPYSRPPSNGGRTVPLVEYQILEDDNLLLRQKIQTLKKQVADLTATNDVLLDQNARLRTSGLNSVDHLSQFRSLLSNTSADVSVTPSLTPIVTSSIINPNAAHTALSALTSNLSQQIALNKELASQQAHALQQRLNDLGVQQRNTPSSVGSSNVNRPQFGGEYPQRSIAH